jgi:hypothetical protein
MPNRVRRRGREGFSAHRDRHLRHGHQRVGDGDALARPASATFALAPYASDVEKLAERARSEGHEVLLQVLMEPYVLVPIRMVAQGPKPVQLAARSE